MAKYDLHVGFKVALTNFLRRLKILILFAPTNSAFLRVQRPLSDIVTEWHQNYFDTRLSI